MNERTKKLVDFLKLKYPGGVQMFNTRNVVGDITFTVYDENGITVEDCSFYDYIEIFGLTSEEWEIVVEECADDFTKEHSSRVLRWKQIYIPK